MINKQRLQKIFLDLVKISSPPLNERFVADYIKAILSDLNLNVIEDDAGKKIGGNTGNLLCSIPGNSPDVPPIALVTHMDTVIPCENIEPTFDGDVFRVQGKTVLGADDKAAVAEVLEFVYIVLESNIPHGDIEIVFTISEETYMHGSKGFDIKNLKSKIALILDEQGAPGSIVHAAPHLFTLDIACRGKAAHAGMCPEKGISAIQIASDAISSMTIGRLDEETTANIGLITGGYARNIVAETVKLEAESRSLSFEKVKKQVEHMITCFQESAKKWQGSVDIKLNHSFQGYFIPETNPFIQLVNTAGISAGLDTHLSHSGGGTDANIFNSKGLTSLVLSCGYRDMHSSSENVSIVDMENTVIWLSKISELMNQKEWIQRLT